MANIIMGVKFYIDGVVEFKTIWQNQAVSEDLFLAANLFGVTVDDFLRFKSNFKESFGMRTNLSSLNKVKFVFYWIL